MTYHAMFSLYITTGLLALVISVSLFCESVAEAKEWIAETLDVAPACFDTYGIERYDELVHALFLLEDRFGIEPCADGSIRFTDEAIQSCVCTWRDWKEFLEKGKITREEYEDRKDGSMR